MALPSTGTTFNPLRQMVPFNLELMKLTEAKTAGLKPVTSLDYYETVGGNLHEDGLFSISIFGRVGDEARDQRFSYISLGTTIFHPVIYKTLVQLKGLYQGIMAGTIYAKWDEKLKDFVATNELQGQTGYAFFVSHWKEIEFQRTRSPIRDIRLQVIEKYKDRAMTDKVLVLPAGLRDIEEGDDGRPVVGEVNTFYRKLLAVARTVGDAKGHTESPALNLPRNIMQQAFNDIFDYYTNMLQGKKGFLQNRWGARRIASGTRNVISAMNASTAFLGGKRSPKFTDTIVGLYQMSQAALPITIFSLRTKYLESIFGLGDGKARLVDPKTLKGEIVHLEPTTFDLWTTNEGLEKFINAFSEISVRKKPVMVEDYYLALIYRGPDGTFKIFSDIDDLPKEFDRKYVHPLTAIELLYLSGFYAYSKLYGFITRYPITGTGSTYPASIYLKTTTEGEERRELDDNWQPLDGDEFLALEFPRADIATFVDSLVISPTRLAGLSADFDGDTASLNVIFTEESIAACKKYLDSKNAYVDPRGGLRASSSTLTSELVLRSMTA
jgi:hypothetical protein